MEDTKWVKEITAKPGGRTGTYWKVTWHDDKTDNIFDSDMLATLEEARSNNYAVHFKKEKSESSRYYNITALSLMKDNIEFQEGAEKQFGVSSDKQVSTVGETRIINKDQSIENQVAYKEACELARAGTISREEIPTWYKIGVGLLSGHIKVKDDDVFRSVLTHCSLKE